MQRGDVELNASWIHDAFNYFNLKSLHTLKRTLVSDAEGGAVLIRYVKMNASWIHLLTHCDEPKLNVSWIHLLTQ